MIINVKNQSTAATAAIIRFAATPEIASAVADLSAGYPDAQRVWRGIAIIDRRHVLVQDEINAEQPVDVAWHMHTKSTVKIDGSRATFTQDDRTLYLRVLSPANARLYVAEAETQPPQLPLKNVRRLTVTLPEPATPLQLVIVLSTDADAEASSPSELTAWPTGK
ncbi:MAG: hypothetical protein ABI614_08980 [Planctomycetota bacterium]